MRRRPLEICFVLRRKPRERDLDGYAFTDEAHARVWLSQPIVQANASSYGVAVCLGRMVYGEEAEFRVKRVFFKHDVATFLATETGALMADARRLAGDVLAEAKGDAR